MPFNFIIFLFLVNQELALHFSGKYQIDQIFLIVFSIFSSAPEVMQDHSGFNSYYGPKADIWSLGAILYYMTYGRPPLYRRNAASPPPGQAPTRDRYLNDILHRTLTLNPHSRADINSVLRHPYTTS